MVTILFLSACNNSSFKEESKTAVQMAKTILNEKAKNTNKQSGQIHFYLPAGFEIKDESSNNIILKNGAETYILFINPQEDTSSDVVYQATVEQYTELDMNEKFTKDNNLGFLTIKRLKKDKLNELTIGVGGAKITTQAKTSILQDDSKHMMEIVNSIEIEK